MSTQTQPLAPLSFPTWSKEPGADGAALSPSQITGYLNCSAAWHYKYRLRLPETKTSALALGRAVHRANEGYLNLQARSEAAEQPAAIIWHARAAMLKELQDTQLKADEDADALIIKAGEMAAAFHRDAPRLTPALVHSETGPRPALEVELLGTVAGVPVRGVADVLTMDDTIVDFKTSSRSPSDISNAHRIQLTTYAELTGAKAGQIITITKAKEPKVISQTFQILASDREHVRAIYPIIADAMAQGFAVPNRTSTFCSRKNCSFWRACQADYGGTVSG